LNSNEHTKTENAHAQMAHLVLPITQADLSAKPKEPFFANGTGQLQQT